jgi:hypothetical protein
VLQFLSSGADAIRSSEGLFAIEPALIGHQPRHRLSVSRDHDFFPLLYAVE